MMIDDSYFFVFVFVFICKIDKEYYEYEYHTKLQVNGPQSLAAKKS